MLDTQHIPDDVLFCIFNYLSAPEILTMREVCETFQQATKCKHVWLMVVSRDVYSDIVPSYCKPFDALSAHQTEVLALHLLRVQNAVTSGLKPVTSCPLHQPRNITWVHILQGAWLLVATCDSTKSILSLWSVHAVLSSRRAVPAPAAQLCLRGPVSSGRVCTSASEVVIALETQSRERSIELVAIRSQAEKPVFVQLAHLANASCLRCLTDRFLGFAVLDELSIPCLMDWRKDLVIKLRDEPDRDGGCVAMGMEGNTVAIVTPKKLEIYIVDDAHTARRVREYELPAPFGFAELKFYTPSQRANSLHNSTTFTRLRLILSRLGELYLFEVVFPRLEDIHFRVVWQQRIRQWHDVFRPMFGASSAMISYFVGKYTHWEPVAYATSFVPLEPSLDEGLMTQSATSQTFFDSDMPALYGMGVRDHDEGRGLAVFGNAFGELSLYDFSGSDHQALSDCFAAMTFPGVATTDTLPDSGVSVISSSITNPAFTYSEQPTLATPTPPFPYHGPGVPSKDLQDALMSIWAPHLPDHVPEGWTTDLLSPTFHPDTAPWHRWTGMLGSYSWRLEPDMHILGTKIPLMVADEPRMTVFRCGGLLYLEHEAWDGIRVLDEGSTVDDVPPVLDGSCGPLPATRVLENTAALREEFRFRDMWAWEWYTYNRNRWQEMKDRGGDVDKRWTSQRPQTCGPDWKEDPDPVDGVPDYDPLFEDEATVAQHALDSDAQSEGTMSPAAAEHALPTISSPATGSRSPSPSSVRTHPQDQPPEHTDPPADEAVADALSEADSQEAEDADSIAPLPFEPLLTLASPGTPPPAAGAVGKRGSRVIERRRPRRSKTSPPQGRAEPSAIVEDMVVNDDPTVVEPTSSGPSAHEPQEEEGPAYRWDLKRRSVRRRFTE